MPLQDIGIKMVVEGMQGFNSALDKIDEKTKGMGKNLAIVGVGIAGVGVLSVKSAFDIDKAMDKIQVATGASGKEMEIMGDIFEKVFKATGLDTEDLAGVIGELSTRLDVSGKELEDLSLLMAEFGRMTDTNATEATIALTQAMNKWGLESSEAAGLMDKLFVATQQSGIEFTQLTTALATSGATLATMGFSIDESIALLASFEKAGVDSGTAIMGLKSSMGKLIEAGGDAQTGLQMAIDAIKAATSESDAAAIAVEIFGSRAGVELATAIRAGNLELGDFVSILGESEGALMRTAEETRGAAEKVGELKATFTLLLAKIGDFLIPILEKLMGVIAPIIEGFVKFNEATGGAIIYIAGAVGLVVAIAKLQGVFTTLGGIVSGLLGLGPLGLLLVAIAGISIVVLLLKDHWDTVWNAIKTIATTIWDALKTAYDKTLGVFIGAFQIAIEWIRDNWETIWNGIKTVATTVWDAIKGAYDSAWGWLLPGGALIKGITWIRDNWETIWNGVKTIATTVWGTIKTAYDTTIGFIAGKISTVWDGVATAWSTVWSGLVGVVTTAWSGIVSVVTGTINGLIGGINALIYGMNVINPFGNIPYIPYIGGYTPSGPHGSPVTPTPTPTPSPRPSPTPLPPTPSPTPLPTPAPSPTPEPSPYWWKPTMGIPYMQRGGHIFKGGMAMVGERGPELVSLPTGAVVSPISNRNTTYNLTANYSRSQEPQGIRYDLEALMMMARS